MKSITYYASNDSMGDTSNENCNNFRQYAKEALENEYPYFEITVSDEQSLTTCITEGIDDDCLENEINEFCHGLWDGCPDSVWTFEND